MPSEQGLTVEVHVDKDLRIVSITLDRTKQADRTTPTSCTQLATANQMSHYTSVRA